MSTHQLVKTMERPLTPDEETEVLNFLPVNEDMPMSAIVEHFEHKFKTTITHHCIAKLMLRASFM